MLVKRLAAAFFVLLTLPGLALAQVPFTKVSPTVTLAVSSVSANVAIGTSARISDLWVCNTGTVDSYLQMGDSTVVADTTGTLMRSGRCGNVSPDGKLFLASVTASGTTTLSITPGSGIMFTDGGGGSGSGSPVSVTAGCAGVAINPTPGTGTFTISSQIPPVVIAGASPAISAAGSNCGAAIFLTNASADTPNIPAAGSAGYPNGWFLQSVCNVVAFTKTLTPASGTIGGAGSYSIPAGTDLAPKCIAIESDGVSNYRISSVPSSPAGVTAMTCPGTVASSVGAVTCVVDYQIFLAGTSGNWTKPTGNYTVTRVFGCGAGGSGGSGAITTSGTVGSGGASGGSGDCRWKEFKTADLAGTVAYVVAGTTAGGAAKTSTTSAAGNAGNQGANTTFGSYTWYGGAGGGQGNNSASASTGGGGAGPYAAGSGATGFCGIATQVNGGGSGSAGPTMTGTVCSSGGSGGTATGASNPGGSSGEGASSGGSGGGINATPLALAGGAGGLAPGCQTAGAVSPAGTAGGATPAIAIQDFPYHPGCGGGGGGGTTATAPTTAASGAAGSGPGASGGGGGVALANASANTSGAGGAGFGGVLIVVSF